MATLRSRDLDDVLEVSHQSREWDSVRNLQHHSLRLLEGVFKAESSCFFCYRCGEDKLDFDRFGEHGLEGRFSQDYQGYFYHTDPLASQIRNNPHWRTSVSTLEQLVRHDEFVRSDFYHRFMRPLGIYHIMGITLFSGHEQIGLISLHRRQRESNFSSTDVTKALLMAPALSGSLDRLSAADSIGAEITQPCSSQRMSALGLTRREIEVVGLVDSGLTSAQMGGRLGISVRTVENHLRSIYEKLGVHRRTHLLRYLRTLN